MARKFKNGDKARILSRIGEDPYEKGFRKGMVVTITGYFPDVYPYSTENKKGNECCFTAKELELV